MAQVKEFKEVIKFGISLGMRTADALSDGKLTWADGLKFVGVLGEANAALQGAQSIIGELADLSAAEKDEIVTYFKAEFDIADDQIEKYVELGFAAAMSVVRLIAEWRAK